MWFLGILLEIKSTNIGCFDLSNYGVDLVLVLIILDWFYIALEAGGYDLWEMGRGPCGRFNFY